jgi:DNA-binding transcriptional regulator YiaG
MAMTANTSRVLKLARARRLSTTGEARQVRLAQGLSLRDVAEAVGVGVTTLWRWEQARNSPHGEAALRWVDLLDQLSAAGGDAG